MISKPTKVLFKENKLLESFQKLSSGTKEDVKLHKWILKSIEDWKHNGFCGVAIPKNRVPKKCSKYNSIWEYDLPNGYRLIYTIEKDEIIIYSIILEWTNHKKYNNTFKY